MGSYAQGLLKKQPFLRARERVLMTWIESAVTEYPKEKDVIEEITFSHKTTEAIQHAPSQGSRTEYAALNIEHIQDRIYNTQNDKIEQWKRELEYIRYELALIEAACLALTPEERALVERHYYEGKSLDALSQAPLLNVIRSRSTLKRMLKNISLKVEAVLSEDGLNDIDRFPYR